ITREEGLKDKVVQGYWIEEVDDPTYLPGHAAAIYLKLGGNKDAKKIGQFGILHPTVLKNFELPFPASVLEMDVEVFL
ncbi:hypothetical protein KC355_g13065, partial [Hortaea werneckii]